MFGINSSWTEWYVFRIGVGDYSIYKYRSGSWYALQPWTSSSYINTGTSSNRLKVIRDGSQIKAYVNDHYLTTVTDSDYTGSRRVGLFARTYSGTNVDARFDNFRIDFNTTGTSALGGVESAVAGSEAKIDLLGADDEP
jgi:hypothetical protein